MSNSLFSGLKSGHFDPQAGYRKADLDLLLPQTNGLTAGDKITSGGDRSTSGGDRLPSGGDRLTNGGDKLPSGGDKLPSGGDRSTSRVILINFTGRMVNWSVDV